jgi:hypothetical protein
MNDSMEVVLRRKNTYSARVTTPTSAASAARTGFHPKFPLNNRQTGLLADRTVSVHIMEAENVV